MFYKWRTQRAKARFYRLTAGIMTTPPMPVVEAPWTIISMVSKSDPQMYILAMKSFYRHMKRGKIIAIVDRDMPDEKRNILSHHLPGIKLVYLEDIETGPCQRGGTWERILYVLDHTRDEYAIQIDADTLTFGPEDIQEVKSCVENNRVLHARQCRPANRADAGHCRRRPRDEKQLCRHRPGSRV